MTGDRLIKIYVGEDMPKPYLVQQELLFATSDYFRKALQQKFVEGHEGVLRFPQDDADAWVDFLHFIFYGKLPEPNNYEYDLQSKHSRLWIMGDKYIIPRLQNAAMTVLLASTISDYVELDVIKEAFEQTVPGAHLRKLMAREAVATIGQYDLDQHHFDMFDGILGFMSEYMRAVEHFSEKRDDATFMVAEGKQGRG